MDIQINSLFSILLLLFAELNNKPGMCISLDKFLTLSSPEKHKFDEFKQRVKSHLPHDYMREDVYLIRFLRENDFNVPASVEMLLNMVRWREENKIDEILTEDFSELEHEYRGYVEGCDKEGRPVLSVNVGDLDFRRAILAGKGDKLMRYMDRIFEQASTMLREMQGEGQNVTQVTVIFDLSGFNMVSHGCPRCIPPYIYILTSFQTHYPFYLHKLVGVNLPSYALPFWDVYKHLMSPKLRDILVNFGKDKVKWQNYLFQEIDPSQLSKQFGGTKTDNLDMYEILYSKKVFGCDLPFSEYKTPFITQ